uniref:Putative microtubule-associated protein futsch-like n=2 Tax=Davidia involucrata TaxID=16924 RepID=A0A5B6ZU46_DAVIN
MAEEIDTLVAEETLRLVVEETLDIPVTIEKIELEGGHIRRNLSRNLSIPNIEGGHIRRNLIRNLSIPNSGLKVPSRYLRASVGSCHDFCKHGTQHVSETNARSPLAKRITATPFEGQDLARTVNLVQRKKTSVTSPKPLPDSDLKEEVPASTKKVVISSKQVSSPGGGIDVYAKHASNRKQQEPSVISPKPLSNSKSRIPNKLQIIKKEVPASTVKEVSSPREGIMVSPKHASVGTRRPLKTKSSPLSNPGHFSTRRFSEITVPKGMGARKLSRRNSDINTSKEVEMRKKNDLVPPTFSLSPKPSVKSVLSPKSGSYKNPKRVSHLKNQNTVKKDESEHPIAEIVPEKTLYVIETKPENFTVDLTQNGSHTNHSSPSSEDKNLGYDEIGMRTSQFPPSSDNKNLTHTQNGIQSTRSSSSSSLSSENESLKCTQNGTHDTELSSSSLSLLSSSSSASESLQTDESSPISESSENETESQIANQKVDLKTRPRRVGGIRSEDKNCSPRKLNFRRGKLVDVQSENNSPRRLRFRQAKVRSENQIGIADTKRRLSLRRLVDGKSKGTETESEKVVLRHKAVEGRRDVQSLYNNVIGETASKLNFRRGKLVDVQSENNGPRRLRFRQGKVGDENQNGMADTKRRSSRIIVAGKSIGSETKSEKVVLRHQAVKGRKDVQSLFNNVIEETASKLVRARKSKVKALVGAFETVISLQDTKSMATTSAQ